MVCPSEFREKVERIILQDYQIEFLGKNFDIIVKAMSINLAERIYSWIKRTMKSQVQPIMIKSKRKYGKWPISELLVFRYLFTIGKTDYRILFVKVKNCFFIEFHLSDHNYYDKVRKDMGLKK